MGRLRNEERTGQTHESRTRSIPLTDVKTGACDVADEDLVAYADGDLRGAWGEWVEAHLTVCPHCKQRFAAFAAVDAILQQTPLTLDDPHRRASMYAKIEQEATRGAIRLWGVSHLRRHYRPRWPRAFVVAFAFKLTLLVLVLWPGLELNATCLRVSLVLATLAVIVSVTPLHDGIPE